MEQRMFIPEIGTKIKLTKDWTFTLHKEYRNESLLLERFPSFNLSHDIKYTLPAETILTVDRIYIRKGNEEYSSLSFTLPGKKRFWAKLSDVNNIHFNLEKISIPIKIRYDGYYENKLGSSTKGRIPITDSFTFGSYHHFKTTLLLDKDGRTKVERNIGLIMPGKVYFTDILKVEQSFSIAEKSDTYPSYTLGMKTSEVTYYSYHVSKPLFKLFTLDGTYISEHKSVATLKKYIKQWIVENIPEFKQ